MARRAFRYVEIADELRHQIERGFLPAHSMLPSEADLGDQFDCSRVTVRKALELLRQDGLAAPRHGTGWFVVGPFVRQRLAIGAVEQPLAQAGVKIERRVHEYVHVAADERLHALLGTDSVARCARVTFADDVPLALVTIWLPDHLTTGLSAELIASRPLVQLLSFEVTRAEQTIAAAAANDVDAGLLHMPVGSPVLFCERMMYGRDDRDRIFARCLFPGHRLEFAVDLTPGDSEIIVDTVESFRS